MLATKKYGTHSNAFTYKFSYYVFVSIVQILSGRTNFFDGFEPHFFFIEFYGLQHRVMVCYYQAVFDVVAVILSLHNLMLCFSANG